MPIEWVSTRQIGKELNMDYRTFQTNYADKWPPERTSGSNKYWKRSTVNKIKEKEFGIIIDPEVEIS